MTRDLNSRVTVTLTLICLVAGSSVLFAGNATPKKMNGTWSSISTIPPNDILGNTEPVSLPELDTFSTSGTAISSSAATVLPLTTDQGIFLAATQIGQGSWKFKGGRRFAMTQWRFFSDATTGEPLGYLKLILEWRLSHWNAGQGVFQVEMLQLDMTTPYTSGGNPVVIQGPFAMWRLAIEPLP